MAADDDMPETEIEADDFEVELTQDVGPEELDEDALDEDALDEVLVEDDEFAGDDEFGDSDDEDADDLPDSPRRAAPVAKESDEDDDDDDMLTPDDVEADLDTILKDRLVANDDVNEDDEESAEVDDPRSEPGDRLQPKRPDEQQCTSCFLLVRSKAPGCPIDDDACPIFS